MSHEVIHLRELHHLQLKLTYLMLLQVSPPTADHDRVSSVLLARDEPLFNALSLRQSESVANEHLLPVPDQTKQPKGRDAHQESTSHRNQTRIA